jgi:glycosyltransferase involved in cell wall biosynthesis
MTADDSAGPGSLLLNGPVIHVVDSVQEEASGPSYSVPRLCGALSELQVSAELWTIDDSVRLGLNFTHRAFRQDFCDVPGLRELRFSRSMSVDLQAAGTRNAIYHVHGLWRMANVYPALAALRHRRPLVLSPRGMLGEAALNFSARKKQLFGLLAQRQTFRVMSCLHATSRQEYDDIRAFGLTAPVAIIPNGVDVPDEMREVGPSVGPRTLLYLGRLHAKKGLAMLLEAWKLVHASHPDWRLQIVGPVDSAYARDLKARSEADANGRVTFSGPLYGQEKLRAYRDAELFILPTLNENFAMTVAEALATGTPVIATRGAPWSGLETYGCGWWVDADIRSLAETMSAAMRRNRGELRQMGLAGREWMVREFSWSMIAQSMASVYGWLSGQSDCPSCVVK